MDPDRGVNPYAQLIQWVKEDIGDIRDLAVLDRLAAFVDTLRTRLQQSGPSVVAPPYFRKLRASLDRISALSDRTDKLTLLNDALRSVFVDSLLTEHSYKAHAQSLRTGEELALRRSSRNPLPTMDALILLASDPRSPSSSQRAALLTMAALKIHASAPAGVPILGTTLVPGEISDSIAEAGEEISILVLVSGFSYIFRPGIEAADLTLQSLCAVFEWICEEAENLLLAACMPATGDIPALVTAASRTTCHLIRQILESDIDNARGLAEIDRCLFAVCLDGPESANREWGPDVSSLEYTSRHLFGNYRNRWYGKTCLCIASDGEAGIIASYNRGIEAAPALSFGDVLHRESLRIHLADALPASDRGELDDNISRTHRVPFRAIEPSALTTGALAEINALFHHERAFFELDLGKRLFQSIRLSPNSALQFLIMVAAHEATRGASLPAMSHAVSTSEGAGLKGGLDWIVTSTVGVQQVIDAAGRPNNDAELLGLFSRAVNLHAQKVSATRMGYSPSFFVRKPEGAFDEMLYRFFAEIGMDYETAYRSYIFRATRWPNTMDILTSTLKLPENVRFAGRPGATCEVAAMFGLHIVMTADQTNLFFIPNPNETALPEKVHGRLQEWVKHLRNAVITSPLQPASCA